MAYWQEKAIAIARNVLHPSTAQILRGTIAPGTETAPLYSVPDYPGYEWENTMLLTPGRPGRGMPAIAAANTTTVAYSFGGYYQGIQAVGIIGCHSLYYYENSGDTNLERLMEVRIRTGVGSTLTTRLDWQPLAILDWSNLGPNFFVYFANPILCNTLYVDFRMTTRTGTTWGAAVGAVVAGGIYSFPHPILAPLGRGQRGGAIMASRPNGPVTYKVNEMGTRFWSMRTRFESENERVALDRLLMHRGIASNSHAATHWRLDMPTVFVPPDLWGSPSSTYGSCAFGRFAESQSYSVVGGGAYTDLSFEENV